MTFTTLVTKKGLESRFITPTYRKGNNSVAKKTKNRDYKVAEKNLKFSIKHYKMLNSIANQNCKLR